MFYILFFCFKLYIVILITSINVYFGDCFGVTGADWTVCRVLTPSGASKCLYGVPGAITGTQRHGIACWYQRNLHRTKCMVIS